MTNQSLKVKRGEGLNRFWDWFGVHPLWALVQAAAGIVSDPGLALCRIHSDATAPVAWYVAHIAGCLVGFASRLNATGLAEALPMLQVHLHRHVTPQAFAARVLAELIRLFSWASQLPLLPYFMPL